MNTRQKFEYTIIDNDLKTRQGFLAVLLPMLLLLIVVSGIFVYVPVSMMLLDAPVPLWAFFLAIVLLLDNRRSRHY
ncbi:MAG: hypothetical protein OXN17_13140 [Candidatus Poribacteria bacterium]|nr:hypothetical protein [Candidatus Poribacteria bacterium]MDE0502641.1 hypothetical protein [Candidatus Poribacteria bacterium]